MEILKKKYSVFLVILLLFFTVINIFYVKFIPQIINIKEKMPKIESFILDKTGYNLKIINPEIKTFHNFSFSFGSEEIIIYNSKKDIVLSTNNFLIKIQPLKLLLKKFQINELKSQNFYFDCTPLTDIFSKTKEKQTYNCPLKIDINNAAIQIDGYEVVFYDKKINKKIQLKGNIFDIKPLDKKLSNLTTDGALSIDKNFSSFNLNIIGKFIFGKKNDFQNFSATGYINNVDLEKLAPYLNKFTEYKQAKGIINLKFNTIINEKKENLTEITATIQDLFLTNSDKTLQTLTKGLSIIKLKTKIHGKNLIFEEIKLNSNNINLLGTGKIHNYMKKKPSLNIMFNLNSSSVSDIADFLPYGIIKEIDIIKEKGIYGQAKGVLKITGKFPDLQFYGKADITDVQATKTLKNTHSGNIKLRFKDTTVYVTVDMKTNKGEKFFLDGNGKIYNDDWSYFDIETSKNLDLHLVREILVPVSIIFDFDVGPVPLFSITSGTGSSKMHIKGKKEEAYIDGFVKINNASGNFEGINTNLSNVNTLIDFKGENIYFDTQSAFADNNTIRVFGEGTTTGALKLNIASDKFNGIILQKIITTSPFLQDAASAFKTIESISGNLKFNVFMQGKFEPGTNLEQFAEIIDKMSIDGNLKLLNNIIKIKDFDNIVKIEKGNIKFDEKSASGEKITVNFGKNSIATITFNGITEKQNGDINGDVAIESSSISLSDSLNFILKSSMTDKLDINFGKNIDIGGNHSLFLNAKIKNNEIDLKSLNGVIKIFNGTNIRNKIAATSGEINIQNGCAVIKNLKILADKSFLNIDGIIKNINNLKPNFNLTVKGSNIAVKTISDSAYIFPADIKKIIQSCKEYEGVLNTNLKISDNGFNGYLNFKNLSFRHIASDIPVKFTELPINFSSHRIAIEKTTGEIGRTGKFPVFADISVENYMKIPIIKASVALKPNSIFIERYINTKLLHPVKLTGDVNITADINGSVDSLKISPVIKLNKDADISYLTVNFGDNDLTREIKSEIYLQPKNLILKKAEYLLHRIIDGKTTKEIIWTASANFAKNGKSFIPKYFALKTFKERPAKILNFLFKKSIIKNGSFECDITYKADSLNPKITGHTNIINADIPSYGLMIKEGKLFADNNLIKISSKGKILETDFTLNSDIKNSSTIPVTIKNLIITTKKMNLAKLLDTINRWSIEAYTNSTLKNNVNFNISDVIIENGILNAEHIDYKTSPIENLKAVFSLDKDSNLKISAENYKVSEGIAENKITYNFKTGKTDCLFIAKDIDSNATADAFLGLKNQITGKADIKVSFNTQGINDIERFRNIKGLIYFSVKNGNMPKLGSLEYLLRASNIFHSGLTTLSVNNIIELLKPFKQGTFSTITGVFNINKGNVENLRIYSQGINLSLFINGKYNIEDGEADIAVYGKLGKKIENLFGPLGNLSANTLFNMIPRDKNSNLYDKELKKIPDIEYKNQDVKYFRATVLGNINENDSASSFKWLR